MPGSERHRHEHTLHVRYIRDSSEQLFIRVDARSAAFHRDGFRGCSLDVNGNSLANILHMGGLQSRAAPAKHRIDRKTAQQLHEGVETRIIWSEHHGRSNDAGVGECRAHGLLSLLTRLDVWRG